MQILKGFKAFIVKISKEKPKIAKLFKKLNHNPFKKQIIFFAKILYGLKHSVKEWQLKFKTLLKELSFKLFVSNFTVLYNLDNGIFIMTFINDCLFINFKFSEINVVKRNIMWLYIARASQSRGPLFTTSRPLESIASL